MQEKLSTLPFFYLKAGYKFCFTRKDTRGIYKQILLH